jgi:hypothetical protein
VILVCRHTGWGLDEVLALTVGELEDWAEGVVESAKKRRK